MFAYNHEIAATPCEPGVTRKILCYSDQQMMTEVCFEKGAQGNAHKHPHEQITYVAAGSFEFTIGDQVQVVSQRDGVYIPPNVMHGVKALEAGTLVDVFTPKRDDFLK